MDFTKLRQTIESLEAALRCSQMPNLSAMDRDLPKVIRAAVIQHFEFTFELSWKMLERLLGKKLGSDTVKRMSHKTLFRVAAERSLLGEPRRWLTYLDARNKTSHTYNVSVAEDVYGKIPAFLDDAKKLLAALERLENE
jgi:nucleotidyltransferase substrate binding protein (TIGR01987 family)